MSNDAEIENMIVAKGKTAPRITPDMVEAEILATQFHVFPGTMLTVCVLTLQNGFTVTGESACASPENFDKEIGERIALGNAKQKIWGHLGFRLRDQLRTMEGNDPPAPPAVGEAWAQGQTKPLP